MNKTYKEKKVIYFSINRKIDHFYNLIGHKLKLNQAYQIILTINNESLMPIHNFSDTRYQNIQ